jgi:hypothetical protein
VLLNLAVAANLPAGQSFPSISVDGNIGQTTINAILFMANTGIPQFALFDVSVNADWIAANVEALVQSYASYLGVDPSTLIATPPPLVVPIYQPPPPPLPQDQQPASFVLCPDGSSAQDISLCPPPTAGAQSTMTPPSTMTCPSGMIPTPTGDGCMAPRPWWCWSNECKSGMGVSLPEVAARYWYVPTGLALLGTLALIFSHHKRA